MERIFIFGDHLSSISTVLMEAFLRAAKHRRDMEVVAVCDASRVSPRPFFLYVTLCALATGIKKIFNPGQGIRMPCRAFANLYTIARRHGIPVIIPENRDINHPEFIKRLKTEFRPSIGLSFWCVQIFQMRLIGLFDRFVNYHNSLLPEYRGVAATRWSLYNGDHKSGFTFHLVDENIDQGRVLLQDSIEIPPGDGFMEVDRVKIFRAAGYAGTILDLLQKRDSGRPQEGRASYFGIGNLKRMTAIGNPSRYSYAELKKRLKAFGMLRAHIQGKDYEITAIKRVAKKKYRRPALCFTTADNVMVEITRFYFLPYSLHRVHMILKKRLPIL